MLSLNNSCTFKIMDKFSCLVSIFVSKYKLCFSGSRNFHLCCFVYITICMTCNCDRFYPCFYIWLYSLYNVDKEIHPRPCTHHAELVRQISGLCNNANQLAHRANSTGVAGQQSVDEMTRVAKEVWREIKENY